MQTKINGEKDKMKRHRSRNIHRDYSYPLRVIREKNDIWFKRSYRLSKKLFYSVLEMITPALSAKNPEMAMRSSGRPVHPEVLLAATLRYLAGGHFIDIVDIYQLPYTSPHIYFWRTIKAIDSVLDNIKLPDSIEEWKELSNSWDYKMKAQFGCAFLKGTTLALDGIVIETRRPTVAEVGGNISGNRNRKGYYGMVALSAVDVWARFRYSELKWYGSCNDNVAITLSPLYNDYLTEGKIPKKLHIVADEAFCATHNQITTPYSRRSLRTRRFENL